jgi:hypothetical protein
MIDRNLQPFRELTPHDILAYLELMLDRPERSGTRDERAERVLEVAFRNVDCHGWKGEMTADCSRVRLTGGSVTLDLGLSATILRFIDGEGGV